MVEQEIWDMGVAALREEFGSLSPSLKRRLQTFAAAIKSCKLRLDRAAAEAGAGGTCAMCLGECCRRGKNHVTIVDILVYMSDGAELFTPCFEGEICPYIGEYGCLMGPEYRPYNCITFICERIESGLGPLQQERHYAAERELRSLYEEVEQLFDNSFRYGLLRNMERALAGEPMPLLRGAALNVALERGDGALVPS